MRRPITKRIAQNPDQKYSSVLVSKLINFIMHDGKKAVAARIVYTALTKAEETAKKPAMEVLDAAIANAGPTMELKSRRVGGANYQVPIEVPQRRARTLAVRWLVSFARARREKRMPERLAAEILDALEQQGGAFKRKDDIYRMAQANRAFAHYRW